MLSLSVKEVTVIINEISEVLPAWIADIWQKDGDLTFKLKKPQKTFYLIVSIDEELSRIHLSENKLIIPPSTPPAFCMLLRKYIDGSQITDIQQNSGDRTVIINLNAGEKKIVSELSQRHGNVFLLTRDNIILGSLRPNRSNLRDLSQGKQYNFPCSFPSGDALNLMRFQPPDINKQVEQFYNLLVEEKEIKTKLNNINKILNKEIKRRLKRKNDIEEDLKKCKDSDLYNLYGQLLLSQYKNLQKGMSCIEVVNYLDEKQAVIKISLDPKLPPKLNVDRIFQKSKKLKNGLQIASKRLAQNNVELKELNRIKNEIENINTKDAQQFLTATEKTLKDFGIIKEYEVEKTVKKEKSQHQPFHRFHSSDRHEILVGKSNKDNDYLTFKIAKGNDLWLHARDYSGSHVVVPMNKKESLNSDLLLEAAMLTAHYSSARGEKIIDVLYTKRKYVTKLKGAPIGQVRVSQEKVISIRMDQEKLDRLFSNRN